MDTDNKLDLLKRYYYASREMIGAIQAGGVPEIDQEGFFESVVRLIDEVDECLNK